MRSPLHKQGGSDYTEIRLWLLEQPSVRYRRDFRGIRWPRGEGFRLTAVNVWCWRSMRGGHHWMLPELPRKISVIARDSTGTTGFRLIAWPESNINIR